VAGEGAVIGRRDLRPGIRRRALEGAQALVHAAGLDRALAGAAGGAAVLMYHSVTDDRNGPWTDPGYSMDAATFERQMRYLARHRRPLALSELVAMVEAGITPPPRSVVVTFDDGYLDNLRLAGPILKRLGIPATVFVVSGWVGAAAAPWIDLLFTALARRRGQRLTLGDDVLALDVPGGELAAYRRVSRQMVGMAAADRDRLLDEVRAQLDPAAEGPRLLMDWDEVGRWLDQGPGYEIGLHTQSHTALTLLNDAGVAAELAHGRAELERRFGIAAPHFSYPYGRGDGRTAAAVRRAGCRSALLTEPMARITGQSDPFALSRQGAPEGLNLLGFFTGGGYPELSLRLFGRQ